jgi:hypothetical protein
MTAVMNSMPQIQEESTPTLNRAPSLYVHDPYGRGAMVRLAGEKKAAAAAAMNEGITITIETVEADATATACHAPASPMALSACSSACGSSSDGHSEVSETRRKRNKKPRKNRSAGLAGENGERVSVCLDYLKGVCNRKRSRCKFAHPQLNLDAPAPVSQLCVTPAHTRVCEVWALTGFCKFGERCRDYHPAVEEPITKVCAPATTQRMTVASRDKARRLSECSWSDEEVSAEERSSNGSRPSTPTPPPMAAPAYMQAWWEVDAMVFHLSYHNFDGTLQRLFQLLHSPATGLTLERILPVLFGKAIENYERLASPVAALCGHLCGTVPEAQQHEFRCSLLRLADHMLHMTPEGTESDEQLFSMARKQRGTAILIGELYRQGLVPAVRLQSALDYCTRRAASPTDDGNLFVEMACTLLQIVGPATRGQIDLDQTVKRLDEAVSMHQRRQQQMWHQ